MSRKYKKGDSKRKTERTDKARKALLKHLKSKNVEEYIDDLIYAVKTDSYTPSVSTGSFRDDYTSCQHTGCHSCCHSHNYADR